MTALEVPVERLTKLVAMHGDDADAATLRALVAERDALRAEREKLWAECRAYTEKVVRMSQETVAALATARAEGKREGAEDMRERAAKAISDLPTDDYYSSGERHAAEEMQGFSVFTIRNLPLTPAPQEPSA
jgi:flagellar biosynthesis/type III secretory pathway protein FliH